MTLCKQRIRVLMAKTGIEAHDWGIKFVSRVLRDAGMEVVFMGTRQTPEKVVKAALEEDVDVLGLSFHSPTYKPTCQRVVELLRERNATPLLIVGGSILREDIPDLKDIGVAEVFAADTPPDKIVDFIRENVKVASA